jgi:RNA polymerase sigma-70 factor (ECF subfamily)
VDFGELAGARPGSARLPKARRSFEAFYGAEVDRLYRALAVTLGDHHVGREAVDEAMARACARWRIVGGYDQPGGWVYRVALNWARSRWRKVRREHVSRSRRTTSRRQQRSPDRNPAAVPL